MLGYVVLLTFSSAVRFWGWSENEREQALDLAELSERVRQGKPLYGHSDQPEWVKASAANNSTFSQLKFGESNGTGNDNTYGFLYI